MARYELFRTARTRSGFPISHHRLVLAHETRAEGGGYVVGRMYHEGGPLVAALTAQTLRKAVNIFEESLRSEPEYRPQAELYAHPRLSGGQWLSIHARDGATVLVSTLLQPGSRFWVSARYVLETEPPRPDPSQL